jgi:hypothetical protein
MANSINFQKIIEDLSFSQENFPATTAFVINAGENIALSLNDPDDTKILKHILQAEDFVQAESRWKKFQRAISETDAQFAEFVSNARAAFQAPGSFMTDYVSNKDISTVAEFTFENTFFNVFAFSSVKAIKIINYGLGKNLSWCKILFQIKINGEERLQEGYCLRKSIRKLTDPNNNKELINVEGSILNSNMYARSVNNSVIPSSVDINKVTFSDEIAAYYTAKEVNILNFQGLTEETVKEEFRKTFSQAIKEILLDQNKEETDNGQNFEDKYYLFARIDNYYISPRAGEKVLIVVSVPVKNLEAVTKVKSIAQSIIDTAADALAALPDLASKIENITVFDFNELAPNISAALQGGPNAGAEFDYVNAAFGDNPLTKEYVSPQEIETIPSRVVVLPFEDQELLRNIIESCVDILNRYQVKIDDEISKNSETEVFINLSLYASSFYNFYESLINIKRKNSKLLIATQEKKNLLLQFSNATLESISMISAPEVGPPQIQELVGITTLLENDPVTDITFSFLLCNIIPLSKEDNSISISEFLGKYITPGSLAEIKYAQGTFSNFSESNKQCLKDYKTRTINNLKTNTNEFLNNIVSGETIQNAKDSFSKKEWQETLDNLRQITKDRKEQFLDLKTINWDAIIEELISCISDAETRELVRFLLEALKNWLINDIPLACQIPPLPIPKFPLIRLPTFPHLPSMVSSYYGQFGSAVVDARTDILVTLIRSLLNLSEKCRTNVDPDRFGDTNAEDLLNGSLSDGLEQEGVLDPAQENNEEELNEIKLILSSVSQSLTKEEILTLFLGVPNDLTLKVTKSTINNLETQQNPIKIVPPKLGTKKAQNNFTTLADSKVIQYFAKFKNLINPQALEDYQTIDLSNDPDLLCIDNQTLNNNLKDSYLQKGLSEQDALKEIERKDEEVRKVIAELGVALNALNSEFIKMPPMNCQKNPDGSITPGISDKVGPFPESFKKATNKTLNGLLKTVDQSYNFDINNWLNNCTQVTTIGNITNNLFLETPRDVFTNSITSNFISEFTVSRDFSLVTNELFLNYLVNNFKFVNPSEDQYFDFFPISKVTIESNEVSSSNAVVNIQSNNGNFLTSSYSFININSTSKITGLEKEFTTEEIDIIKNSRFLNVSSSFLSSSSELPFKLVDENYNIIETNLFLSSSPILGKNLWKQLFKKINNFYVKQYGRSFIFKTTSIGENSKYSKIYSINLNPLLTPKQKKCGEKDLRLLNIEDLEKIMQENVLRNACSQPVVDQNGKILESQINRSNLESAAIILLRLYAIDFNLKLLPMNSIMTMLKADTFYKTCHEIVLKDIEKLFGITFKERIEKILLEKYFIENNIKDYDLNRDLLLNNNRFNSFKQYFKKEFLEIARKVYPIYEKAINNKKISKTNFSNLERIVYENKYENYLDYLFDNILVIDTSPDRAVSLLNTIKALETEIEAQQLLQDQAFAALVEYFISPRGSRGPIKNITIDVLREILSVFLPQELIEQFIKFITNNYTQIYTGIGEAVSADPFSFNQYLINKEQLEPMSENDKDFLKYELRFEPSIYIKTIIDTAAKIKEKRELLDFYKSTNQRLDDQLKVIPYVINIYDNKAQFKLCAERNITKNQLLNNIGAVDLYNFGEIENSFNYKDDQKFKKVFYQYFSSYYPIEEMLSSYISTILLSLSSINKINDSFNSTKQQIKNVFSIIDLASDYTKDPEDSGLTFLLSQLKVVPLIAKSFVKTFAQATDPNITISSAISFAYKSGVAAAESAGIEIPAKNLPLYVPSAAISTLLPPITPQGYAAVSISVSDETFEITTSATNEDDKCPDEE